MTVFTPELLARAAEMSPAGAVLFDITQEVRRQINPAGGLVCDYCGRRLGARYVRYGCEDFTRLVPGERGRPSLLADLT